MQGLMTTQFAVITGAGQGLGKSFATALAKRKINCILIDLPFKGLERLSQNLHNEYGICCEYYEADLTIQERVQEICNWINLNFDVFILINNAGIGGTKRFEQANADYLNSIIQLNITATILMVHYLLPNLKKQNQSYVLNVSSMAAFSPMGFKTVYPASKTFIHHFTRGLYQEMADTNVFFSVVNPGPMKTNPEISKRIDRQGFIARWCSQSPEQVAEISIRQLFKKDTLIMLNFINGLNWLLMKITPIWIRLPLMTRIIKRELINS